MEHIKRNESLAGGHMRIRKKYKIKISKLGEIYKMREVKGWYVMMKRRKEEERVLLG